MLLSKWRYYLCATLCGKYIQQALNENKFESIANAYSFLGQIKLDQKKIDDALMYFEMQMKNRTACLMLPLIFPQGGGG